MVILFVYMTHLTHCSFLIFSEPPNRVFRFRQKNNTKSSKVLFLISLTMQLKWNWRLTASHYDTKHMKLLHVSSNEDTLWLVWCLMSLFTLKCKLIRHYASKVCRINWFWSFEITTCTSGVQYTITLLHIITLVCLSLLCSTMHQQHSTILFSQGIERYGWLFWTLPVFWLAV